MPHRNNKYHVLIVDDDDANLDLLDVYLTHAGYAVSRARDGAQAAMLLNSGKDAFHAVLTDRIMPQMNGIELLKHIKAQAGLRDVPVIMQTAASSEKEVLEGLSAGAFHYVTKPFNINLLLSVIKSAIEDFDRYRTLREQMKRASLAATLLKEGSFTFNTIEEAKHLASFLSNACPHPHAVVIGLSELLMNAVEHGNLGFSYDEKSRLLASQEWGQALRQRLADDQYKKKHVVVDFTRTKDAVRFAIADEGNGFDWKPYLQLDPARAFDAHGRGIAMAAMLSFSALEYRGKGNQVIATVALNSPGGADQ